MSIPFLFKQEVLATYPERVTTKRLEKFTQ